MNLSGASNAKWQAPHCNVGLESSRQSKLSVRNLGLKTKRPNPGVCVIL